MKLKIKLTTKKVFQLAYIIILLINIIVIFFIYSLINEYVFGAFVIDRSLINMQINSPSSDINTDQFNKVIEKIDNKTNKNDVRGINNIFD